MENQRQQTNEVGMIFAAKQKIKSLLITLSEHGVYYYSRMRANYPAHIRNISDVSGAGDTVISVASLAIAAGFSCQEMAAISNCRRLGL